jgi:hypothetical protein
MILTSLFYVTFAENAIEIILIHYSFSISCRLKYSSVSGNGVNQSKVNKQDRDLGFCLFLGMYTKFMLMVLFILLHKT